MPEHHKKYRSRRFHYYKIYVNRVLRGDIRLEKPITRDVLLLGLVAMAADSPYETFDGKNRILQMAEGIGISDEDYCKILNISMDEWLFAKNRLEERESIKVDDETNIITVVNWGKYQNTYQSLRKQQREYRSKLRTEGFKNYSEACDHYKKKLAESSSKDIIFNVLKFLPEEHHDNIEKSLDELHPNGHEFREAKRMWKEFKKRKR